MNVLFILNWIFSGDGGVDGFMLEQYFQRLKNIQQTLGLAVAEAGNLQIPE